ncbi:hydrogenase iron-sulfur subunit [Methermicoccus shengliensis]|uniref:Hydrogenase iron-sulfur subunit n=1 Tax=Methermicoccus shengliensis TaxID=660064 RepID=A0A832RWL2_9EURY|nr:hydrogenase iron-sulfur subunit [Methermicoccus shengliensis]KUK05197.1 MAG: Methyl-viologen-reducing hydrogenase subunit D [Euryarchaeota archaeon 55_53]KUK30816.1 MAG: Methyl-viologen-reducing hydrogenase subunit D [Methanosarcinales archeaon 56_1174]MDI3487357.1 F420-non-reducing hydrogenase iron-sulfur subunit [Methanosarcinales archaeon]MDN5294569.1 F420-non-reducing hydrogenase iron-sulfur subunit [Methanosarcinales archaeon]HIH69701.1 hydrogenase iron-sulfur subunit [Methermicoccus s
MSIVSITCMECGYGAADTAGVMRMKYDPEIKIVRVPCAGRARAAHLLEGFQRGARAMVVVGCCLGSCAYSGGNFVTLRKVKLVKRFLEEMGYDPDRVNQYTARAAEGDTITGDFEDVMKKADKGPDIAPNLVERALREVKESREYYGVTVR